MTALTWAVVVVLAAIVIGTVLCMCRYAAMADRRAEAETTVRRGLHAADRMPVRDALDTIAGRIHGGDQAHCNRCLIGRDDRYLPIVIPCPEHRPAGRHHATAPVYGPEPVVAKPDFDEWVEEWNRRYAQ